MHMSPKRRKLFFASAALSAALALSACGASATDGSNTAGENEGSVAATELTKLLPPEVQEAGALTVATVIGKPPGTFREGNDVTGMHIDLMEAVAERLGIAVDWQYTGFDGVIPGIQADRYDAAIAQIGDFASREEVVTFVNYQMSGFSFLTTPDNKEDYEDADALCGLRVATSKGSAQTDIVTEASDGCVARGEAAIDIQTYPGTDEQLLALQSDRVDIIAADADMVLWVASERSDQFRQTGPSNFVALSGIPMQKDRQDLAKALAAGVQSLMDDGTYLNILSAWGQESTAIEEAAINGGSQFGWGPRL